jgi:hypothetical protein
MMLGLPALGGAVTAIATFVACGKDTPYVPGPYGTAHGQSASCSPDAGTLPGPSCDGTNNPTGCDGIVPGCSITPAAQCGDKTTCLPMADNSGKTTIDLRFRRLNVFAPATLAQPFVEKAIVDKGVNLQQCGEGGDGSFNWLARIDTTAKTLRTGGAPPTADPFGVGFCFADTVSGSLHIQSITSPYQTAADGTLETPSPIPKLYVPIWLHGDRNTLVILPLTQVIISGVKISTDNNCIGNFNYNHVNNDCSDLRTDCARWTPAGALGGYITLVEADAIPLTDLGGKSLCVVLTGLTSDTDPLHCPNSGGKITAQGDYCSSPAGPGGCQDSYWLAATFAASAVHINNGAADDLCKGGAIQMDAGNDAPADSPSDAPEGG